MDEKIIKLYQNLKKEGVDDVRANDIIQKVKEYYEYISNYNLEQLDYIGALKAIQYGRFLKSNNANGDNAKVWNDTKVYSDNDVVIWKPRNYQESSIIGSPQWCISYRDYHWNDHVIHNGETIYMIYNGWVNEDLQYTSACVERNGNIIIYDRNHNKLNDIDKDVFLKSLGNGVSVLKPQINVENKLYNTNRNMNKKLIRLTESDLHRIVKESVNKILNEIGDTEKGQDALGQVHGRALRRQQMLGGKGAISRKLLNTARAAKEKAYSQAPNHDIFHGDTPFDIGISKGYDKAKTNKSDLHRIVKESVNRVLRESNRREVFTISAFNIENEEDVSDMQYCGQTYYDIDDAIVSATEFAQSLIDYGSVVMVTVYAGEHQTESGDIFGEPQDVYTISNSDRRTTAIARKKCGYSRSDVDAYAV